MEYSKMNREDLLKRIEELEILNFELLREKEEEVGLDYAWTGNLGHWYWNIKNNSVVFNPLKIVAMGYSKEEIPEKVTYQFFTERLHPDDYENTMEAMRKHMRGEVGVYETEYRIKTKSGAWKWFQDRGKITQRDENDKPVFMAGIVFDITEKKQREENLEDTNEMLKKDSQTDALTGLYNRRAVLELLQAKFDKALKEGKSLSVGMFDIDKFKNINDTKGHVFGDKVLSEMASVMEENLRNMDFVGRYGGEEFIVVFPDTKNQNAFKAAERIRLAVEKHDFEEGVKVTVSCGVSSLPSGSLKEFINEADVNLYKAKDSGRNKVVI